MVLKGGINMDWNEWQTKHENILGLDFNSISDEEFERLCVEQLKSYYKEYDVVEKILETFRIEQEKKLSD